MIFLEIYPDPFPENKKLVNVSKFLSKRGGWMRAQTLAKLLNAMQLENDPEKALKTIFDNDK